MTEKPGMLAPYFFLSYARSDPLAGNPRENPDHLVDRFFKDLTDAVKRHASRDAGVVSGFFDQEIPVGSDWKQAIIQALSAAQVFVPLYSVGYLTNSWPGREFACFRRRVEQAVRANPVRRLVPVLWAPLAGVGDPPGLREALAASTEPDYTENGLRALLKPKSHNDQYQAVVNQLAEQIVMLAESDPIDPVEPSQVPDIEKVESEFSPGAPLATFDIEVAAPTAANVPEGRDIADYGETAEKWRPFPGQELSLAEYARQVAEKFDFDARVGAVSVAGDAAGRRPGIILIDPVLAADENGRVTLRSVAETPRWVLPLLILGPARDQRMRELAAKVRAILNADELPTESARRGAAGVESLDEFVSIIPVLVAEAERQYLRYRAGRVISPRSAGRPAPGQRERPDGPGVYFRSIREARDAR
jgi:FxsC-like protein